MSDRRSARGVGLARTWCLVCVLLLAACASVGPDFDLPESPLAPDWYEAEIQGFAPTAEQQDAWWLLLGDADLDRLIRAAREANNTLEIAGLRVLEARAQLGIATGLRFPQTQVLAGGASALGASENAANTAAGDLEFTQFDVGASVAWELDFWGRFRRGIEAAEAAYRGAFAAYDQAVLLVSAQVALTYIAVRSIEEQLSITYDNIAVQERSFDIVNVQFQNGNTSELDVLQARSLLLSTRAAVPAFEADLRQARHALSTLIGRAPSSLDDWMAPEGSIPGVPASLELGVPAGLLRQRPDLRQAELAAMAQNASVGLAAADLYPSFSLTGSIGLLAAGNTDTTRSGESGFEQLFDGDSLSYSAGAGFVWPFFNYGRIRNNVRVQDARLQQALTAWRETVIQAAREVEDAIVALDGARRQDVILKETVAVAQRANEVAVLRFREGFADYQRVLDAQQLLFSQQARYVGNRANIAASFVALYVALGGGWGVSRNMPLVPEGTLEEMRERTNWGQLTDDLDDGETGG